MKKISISAKEIIEFSTLPFKVKGDLTEVKINKFSSIWDSDETCCSFITSAVKNSEFLISECKAALVICDKALSKYSSKATLIVENPKLFFVKILHHFYPPKLNTKYIFSNYIYDPCAAIDTSAQIGHYTIIEDAKISKNVKVESNVHIFDNVEIGIGSTIKSGCIIGQSGFGYIKDTDNKLINFPHLAGVEIGTYVEIGVKSTITSGCLTKTRIGDGTKIDCHVQIGHNAVLGKNVQILAGAIIGGSAHIEDEVTIAVNAFIGDYVRIGAGSFIGAGAIVLSDLKPNSKVASRTPILIPN